MYAHLLSCFSASRQTVPSEQFLHELYADDNPLAILTEYVVAHCVYCIQISSVENSVWETLVSKETKFAQGMSVCLTRAVVKGRKPKCAPTHPSFDQSFAPEIACEIPKEVSTLKSQPVGLGSATKKRTGDTQDGSDSASEELKLI